MSLCPQNDLDSDAHVDLLSSARAGSPEALGMLLESCRTYLLYVGERQLNGELKIKVAPSDLVQETFADGQRGLANFKPTFPRWPGPGADPDAQWLRL